MNASWGMETLPYSRIFALPFFCFSSSFRFLRRAAILPFQCNEVITHV